MRRGLSQEYQLLRLLREKGLLAFRLAGSGKSGGSDIVVFHRGRVYFIEVKYSKNGKIKLRKEQLSNITKLAEETNGEAYIVVKHPGTPWVFINLRTGEELRLEEWIRVLKNQKLGF